MDKLKHSNCSDIDTAYSKQQKAKQEPKSRILEEMYIEAIWAKYKPQLKELLKSRVDVSIGMSKDEVKSKINNLTTWLEIYRIIDELYASIEPKNVVVRYKGIYGEDASIYAKDTLCIKQPNRPTNDYVHNFKGKSGKTYTITVQEEKS